MVEWINLILCFFNQVAEDYGGPRKEFFRLVLNEIKDTFFDKGLRNLLSEKYVPVGILLGKLNNYVNK